MHFGENGSFASMGGANRYSYKGKVNDFQFIKTNDYKVQKNSDSMDYQTFKKLSIF